MYRNFNNEISITKTITKSAAKPLPSAGLFYKGKIMYRNMIILMCLLFFFGQIIFAVQVPDKRISIDQYCYDFVEILPADLAEEINDQGNALKRTYDIDFVVAIIPELDEKDISEYAVNLFSDWEIGKSTQGKKGMLLLIAQKEQRIKIEVGYDLEGIFTDAYVGQVEREMLKEFLEQADWERGFLATIENIVERIIKFYKKGDDVKEIKSDSASQYYSGGAGAKTVFDFGAALNKPIPQTPEELKKYFSAQTTPDEAFQRYMEFNAKNMSDYTVDIFSEDSKKFFSNWKTSSGQRRAEVEAISGRAYIVRQIDNHAVVIFPENKTGKMKETPMYFILKSDKVWQIDINTMTRAMRCVGPGWWVITELFQPYSEIIMQDFNIVNGFLCSWDDPSGYNYYYILDSYFYDAKEPGYHIGVSKTYESKSNLKTGDSILSVNGEKIRDNKHIWDILDNTKAKDEYKFTLLREGKKMNVKEKFMNNPDGFERFRPCLKTPRMWMGVYMVESLDSEWRHTIKLRDQGSFEHSSLCSILEIYPGSPADKAGLKPNDLIVDYGMDDDNGEIMPYDVIQALYKIKPGDSIELTIVRNLKDILKIKIKPEETLHKGFF
ncbi:MAG: hypothetical protein ACD_79C00586G0001 [uncultured bacterium]|nr:MAG: hypothetical protein ACD_79C00586G0001 [uncultured bacterium]